MAASIGFETAKIGASFLKRSAEYITGAAGEYFKDAMPVTQSTLESAKTDFSKINSIFKNSSESITKTVRGFKSQIGLRNVFRWYMDNGDSQFSNDLDLDFDIDGLDDSELAVEQIGETEHSANKISSMIVESNQHLLEGQMHLTANIAASLEKQTAVISTGFDSVNSKLDDSISVLTKNTATMIEATVAASKKEDAANNMLNGGKFNLSDYKKLIGQNIKGTSVGAVLPWLSMATDPNMIKMALSPQELIKMGFNVLMDKKAPNLKKNMQALDDAINETILNSLIRLGENKYNPLAKIFGIDSTRKEQEGKRSSLELKPVAFDSIAHEAITNAIPGYLRKILVQLGGDDMVYDYRSRSFKTSRAIKREFTNASTISGTLSGASDRVRKAIGNDQFGGMIYDIMMADLGSKQNRGAYGHSYSAARDTINSFTSSKAFEDYIVEILSSNGVTIKNADLNRIRVMGKNLAAGHSTNIGRDISNQVARNNVNRNKAVSSYIDEADKYNVDLRGLKTSTEEEILNILEKNGMIQSKVNKASATLANSGVDYTNKALYEIFRLLDRGVNVFKVGESLIESAPYKTRITYLPVPDAYRPKMAMRTGGGTPRANPYQIFSQDEDYVNDLKNNIDENGEMENLTRGQRFSRWAKNKGSRLGKAMFSGSPEEVRAVFMEAMGDIGDVAKDAALAQAEKINQSFGNVTGFINHKLFGSEYKYTDENGEIVHVKQNDKGGVFGFMTKQLNNVFTDSSKGVLKWFNQVKGYFDYGPSGENQTVVSKRKRFITASIGAMAGAGLLGGPLGLLMGGLAGNAIGQADIGSKINDLLFGRDEKGRARGLAVRVLDGVVDPIKYQFEKTAHAMGDHLKKNIFGPLSDIGFAIKDKIESAASSSFGKVFNFIGNILMAPFKLATGIARAPISLMGGLARTASGVSTGIIGAGLNTAANIIGMGAIHTEVDPETGEEITTKTSKRLKERRKARNKQIKEESTKFESYKSWKAATNERRAGLRKEFLDSISEEREIQTAENAAETAENTKQVADYQENINSSVSDLLYHATHTDGDHSIYTHDHGIHERLDKIIDFTEYVRNRAINREALPNKIAVNGDAVIDGKTGAVISADDMFKDVTDTSNILANNNGIASSAVAAAATIATEGNITTDDQKEVNAILTEAEKENSSVSNIRTHMNRLLKSQEKDKEEKEEKSNSLWDFLTNNLSKIGSFIGDNLPAILTALGALSLLSGINDKIELLKNGWDWMQNTAGPWLKDRWDDVVEFGKRAGKVFTDFDIKKTVENILSNIEDGIKIVNLGDDDEDTDATDEGINAAAAVVDKHIEDKWDIVNPFATIFHNQKDANEDYVEDKGATAAKFRYQFAVPITSAVATNNAAKIGANMTKRKLASQAADFTKQYSESSAIARQATKIADALEDSNVVASGAADKYRALADEASIQAEAYRQQAGDRYKQMNEIEVPHQSMTGNVLMKAGTTAIALGVTDYAGNVIGNTTRDITQNLGASRSQAEKYGEIAHRGTVAAATIDLVIHQDKSVVGKVAKAIEKFFKYLAKLLHADKLFAKGASKIDDFLTKIYKGSIGKLTEKIAIMIMEKIEAIFGANVAATVLDVFTAGAPIAIGAVVGVLSGQCGTEYLFGVLPNQADDLMIGISESIRGILYACEMAPVPVSTIAAVFDLIDEMLIKPLNIDNQGQGRSLKRMLAEFAYNMSGNGAELDKKQAAFGAETEYYNKRFGTNIDQAAFSDMVNNEGMVDWMIHGKAKYDEQGHVRFDDIGKRVEGGMSGFFLGGEKEYVKDQEGNIVRNEKGEAIQQRDATGNLVFADQTGSIVNAWNKFARFFAGGDIYEVDDTGRAVLDMSTGEYKVADKEANIFGKTVEAAKGMGAAIDQFGKDMTKGFDLFTEKAKEIDDHAFKGEKDAIINGTFEVAEGTPGDSIINSFLGIEKFLGTGLATVISGGKDLANGTKDLFGRVRTGFNTFMGHDQTISDLMLAGDVDTLNNSTFAVDDSVPGSSIMNGLLHLEQMMGSGVATVIGAGHNISDGAKSLIGKVRSTFSSFQKNEQTIRDLAFAGDVNKLASTNVDLDESVPGSNILNTLLNVEKTIGSPIAGIMNGAKGIHNQFKDTMSTIQSDMKTMNSASDRLEKYVERGRISEIYNSSFKASDKNIIGGFLNAGFTISKLFAVTRSFFVGIANKIKATTQSLEDFWKDPLGTIVSKLGLDDNSSGGSRMGGPTLTVKSNYFNPIATALAKTEGPRNTHIAVDDSNSMAAKLAENPKKGNPLINKYYYINSPFGQRTEPFNDYHPGVDLVPTDGSSNVSIGSTMDGTVVSVKNNVPDTSHAVKNEATGKWVYRGKSADETGNMVTIKDSNGMITKYMHLKASSIPSSIKKGAKVSAGQKIGVMGNTGRSTGAHLHYQVEDTFGTPLDPKPYVTGSKKFADYWKKDSGVKATSSVSSTDTTTDTGNTLSYQPDSSSSTSQDRGILGNLIAKLTEFGSNLLFKITGGLYGSTASNSSSTSSISGSDGKTYTASEAVKKLLEVAKAEVGTHETGNNNVKYNTWYYGREVSGNAYPWCMVFVQWCYAHAGFPLDYKSAGCLDVWNHYKAAGKNVATPAPGDIWIRTRTGGGHTGIVYEVNGNTFSTIEGNSGDQVKINHHTIGEAGTIGFIRLLEQGSYIQTSNASGTNIDDTDVGALWDYFKKKGWSDKAIAGALGCWTSESNSQPNRIEGDHTSFYKKISANPYVDLINDRNLMDTYARDYLLPATRKAGYKIQDKNYKADDGHYYVGLGMAQWTAQRGKQLLDFAKANNIPWDKRSTQLQFMEKELSGAYSSVRSAMEAAPDINAATKVFMNKYEGNSDSTGYLPPRQQNAQKLYAQYAGKGGPSKVALRDPVTNRLIEYQEETHEEDANPRVGGPSIGSNIYMPKVTRHTMHNRAAGGQIIDLSRTSSESSIPIVTPTTPQVIPTPQVDNTPGIVDLTAVIALMNRTVEELVKITNNTASSSTLLNSLNEKDFVDVGLRNTLDALKDVRQRRAVNQISKSSANATAVTNMAKP